MTAPCVATGLRAAFDLAPDVRTSCSFSFLFAPRLHLQLLLHRGTQTSGQDSLHTVLAHFHSSYSNTHTHIPGRLIGHCSTPSLSCSHNTPVHCGVAHSLCPVGAINSPSLRNLSQTALMRRPSPRNGALPARITQRMSRRGGVTRQIHHFCFVMRPGLSHVQSEEGGYDLQGYVERERGEGEKKRKAKKKSPL